MKKSSCCCFLIETCGYAVGMLNAIKCLVLICFGTYLLSASDAKLGELMQAHNTTITDIRHDIDISAGLTLVVTILELLIVLVLMCGINLAIPWMLVPWILVNVISFGLAFANFLRILIRKLTKEVYWKSAFIAMIVIMVISGISLVIILRLYRWLRFKSHRTKHKPKA